MAIDPISAYRNTAHTAATSKSLAQSPTQVASRTPYQELDEYVKMTPAQRMRVDLLKKLGLTEEDLAGMSPEERQGVETKLREMIQQQMQETASSISRRSRWGSGSIRLLEWEAPK